MTPDVRASLIVITAALVLAQGRSLPVRKEAVPSALTAQTSIPGLTDVRYRVEIDNDSLLREGIASVRREQTLLASRGRRGHLPPAVLLAIFGGGDNGAFGAGLLNG